jgi:hypothetical protein
MHRQERATAELFCDMSRFGLGAARTGAGDKSRARSLQGAVRGAYQTPVRLKDQ